MTAAPALAYPPADRDDVVEVWHGTPVADPYRWLEDPRSERTRHWVAAQNTLTEAYLAGLADREWFGDRLRSLLAAPRVGVPQRRAGRYLWRFNDGTREQDQLYVADSYPGMLAGGRMLIDPADIGPQVSISGETLSPDGTLVAYGVNEAGSDWTEWRVRDVVSGADLADRIVRSKFTIPQWLADGSGFTYWGYPDAERTTGDDAAALGAGAVLLHRLGTAQDDDPVLYHDPAHPRVVAHPKIPHGGRWLVLELTEGTERRNRVVVHALGGDGSPGPRLDLVPTAHAGYDLVGADGDVLYFRTFDRAPRHRLVAADLAAFQAGTDPWREVVPEREQVLTAVRRAGDGFLAVYLDDASHRVYRWERDGAVLGEVTLDGPVSVVGYSGEPGEDEAFVGVASFTRDTACHRVSMAAGTVEPVPLIDHGAEARHPVVTERRAARSPDGTDVPYFLVRRADRPVDGPRPTLLYGYGGFDQAITPAYKVAWPAWVDAGGVLVVANLRGGGEYGHEWHQAGARERKQNVFDDLVAVAEHLVTTGVCTRDQLALHGRSNGGLLVGAVMTQRPDLVSVALPMVGVLDMLRFHRFTIGWAWMSDYGDPEVADDFRVLRAYSPLHNLKEGDAYPATLVLTGDHDDRVVPAHSYKFTAELQRVQSAPRPVLARIETATGHGVGKPRSALAAEFADMLAFAAAHTGLSP